jgi:phenylalanyl-tRNA synthetase beta chain
MGYLAALDKKVIGAFDLTEDVFAAEMDLGRLSRHADLTKRFREIPKYPSIKRDVSLTVPGGVAFAQIRALALKAGGKLVENIELLDRYSGKQVPENRQGLAFRVEYRDKTRTLTAEEVDKIHLALRDALVEKLGAALR